MCECNIGGVGNNVSRERDDCGLTSTHIPGCVLCNESEGVGIGFAKTRGHIIISRSCSEDPADHER